MDPIRIRRHGLLAGDGLLATGRAGLDPYIPIADALADEDLVPILDAHDAETARIRDDVHLSEVGRTARLAELSEKSRTKIADRLAVRLRAPRQDRARAEMSFPQLGFAGDPIVRAGQEAEERERREELRTLLAAQPKVMELWNDMPINSAEAAVLRSAADGDVVVVRSVLRSSPMFKSAVVREEVVQEALDRWRRHKAPDVVASHDAADLAVQHLTTQANVAARHVSGRPIEDPVAEAARRKTA